MDIEIKLNEVAKIINDNLQHNDCLTFDNAMKLFDIAEVLTGLKDSFAINNFYAELCRAIKSSMDKKSETIYMKLAEDFFRDNQDFLEDAEKFWMNKSMYESPNP